MAGWTESFGAGKGDVWILGLDEDGNIKWQKTYGGKWNDWAKAVAVAPNGDIIVAGYTGSFGAGDWDVWVLRLDENGNIVWQKTYGGGSNYDEANAIALTDNGDIIVTGETWSFGIGEIDVWVLRLDENGNVKWQKTYGGSDQDWANSVAIAPNGDVIVAGVTNSFGTNGDMWVLRLDENGNVKWQKTYGGSNGDKANAVAIADNGDILVAGEWGSGCDFLVLRLDENGNVKWQKLYGKDSDCDEAHAVVIAPNGDIIVAGTTEKPGTILTILHDAWILRLPPDGNLPGCDFCKDTNAQVSEPYPVVENSNTEIYVTSAKIEDSTAYPPHSWYPHVETQYGPSTLSISSQPSGVGVYINGTYKGRTPLTLTLSPGTYRVELFKGGVIGITQPP
ncbi:PEGA domain-containing protein [Thermococcus sp. JCM 11816]|uniref:PEGA domain-containing protein n=1 Tax=Thermococcus sp. (strain JCM 11816 / KS-1) TaxID=1295125 RepID=UPI0006D0DD09